HFAGLKYGMIWTESATNLGALPPTGAFYCFLGPKYEGGPYGEGRAFSIVGGNLPTKLINACKNKKVIDLSPVNSPKLPITSPGRSTGQHRQAYLNLDFLYSDYLDMWHHARLLDSMAGTHLVPPAYALPKPGEKVQYSNEIMAWLKEYESKYGPRGTSEMTTEKVPLEWTAGNLRVIDVRKLLGTTDKLQWPASPEITADLIKSDELANGPIQPGEVVAFYTGHVEKYLKPVPEDKPLWADPLSGKAEGWPAPGPGAVFYLKSKGVRCLATDAPDLGGAEPKRALMTYWALGSSQMAGVEFLQNFGMLPRGKSVFFLFAALKVRDCHGGPGRAIAAVLD
ncbi:MAG: cyclase family protein, partial [bacterium]